METDASAKELAKGLRDALRALETAGIPFLAIGSIAGGAYGGPSWPRGRQDIDFLVRKDDAQRGLEAFTAEGWRAEVPEDKDWLVKAHREPLLVDLIFRAGHHVAMDDEMLERARTHEIAGANLKVVPPEDYAIMQMLAFSRETPTLWFDALTAVGLEDVDWDYLLRRAEPWPDRLLSLLLFARAEDVEVPERVLKTLWRA